MKNNNKGYVSITVLIILLVLVLGGLYIYSKNKTSAPINVDVGTVDNGSNSGNNNPPATTTPPVTVGVNGNCGLYVQNPAKNTQVNFPFTIQGIIDNTNTKKLNCSWQMFEGQAGSAQLYFYTKADGWQKLGNQIPVPVANWTAVKTTFSVTFTKFKTDLISISSGTPLKVIFTEENASGIPPVDTYEFPLIYK